MVTNIRKYGSTLHAGMAPKQMAPYISIASDDLKYIQIGFNTHIPIHI